MSMNSISMPSMAPLLNSIAAATIMVIINYRNKTKEHKERERESWNQPARIRPEWYEAFLREPESAATLITGAITL